MLDTIHQMMAIIEDPRWFFQRVGILFVLFCLGALLTALFVGRMCRMFCGDRTFSVVWSKLETPNVCLGGLAAVFAGLSYMELPETLAVHYLFLSLRVLLFVNLFLWFSRLLDSVLVVVHNRLVAQGKPIPVAVFFFGRVVKGMFTLVVMVAVVPSLFFGYQVLNTMVQYLGISSLGVGAIAGLSLQPTMRDVLGGVSVMTQNLFTEGDWIEYKAGSTMVAGRVVDVTLRYTRLKRWTGSFLMVPNNTFLSAVIDNYGRAHYTSYALTLTAGQQETSALQAFIGAYRALIKDSPYIEEDKCHMTVRNLQVGKMALELHIFFNKMDDEDKVLRIHAFWQDILALVQEQKLSVAV